MPHFFGAAEPIRFDRSGGGRIYCTACERASAPALGDRALTDLLLLLFLSSFSFLQVKGESLQSLFSEGALRDDEFETEKAEWGAEKDGRIDERRKPTEALSPPHASRLEMDLQNNRVLGQNYA